MKFKCLLSSEPRRNLGSPPRAERAEHALEIWRNFRFLARARGGEPADAKGKGQKGKKGR